MEKQTNNNPSTLASGTNLRGTYRIDRFLSSGGFGNTYVATNMEFDEQVAIKEFFIKKTMERDGDTSAVTVSNAENQEEFEQQLDKFKKEARRIRKLQNDHIIKVHDLFEENGTAYYVMDYIDGESLSDRLKRTGKPMTEDEVKEILPQILDGLKSVHDINVWHMDLKPSNIMIDKRGKVTIIDFGSSKHIEQGKNLTTSLAVAQSKGYCPPEQTQNTIRNIGAWTDIYALGATLYCLLTRKTPPTFDVILNEEDEAFFFPSSVSPDMQNAIIWMMKPNRKERPQSVEEVLKYFSNEGTSINKSIPVPKEENEETILETKDTTSAKQTCSDSGEETILEQNLGAEETILEQDENETEYVNSNDDDDDSLNSLRIDFIPLLSSSKIKIWISSLIACIGIVSFYYFSYYTFGYNHLISLFVGSIGVTYLMMSLAIGLGRIEEDLKNLVCSPLLFFGVSIILDTFLDAGIIRNIFDYLWRGIYILASLSIAVLYTGKLRLLSGYATIHAIILMAFRCGDDVESIRYCLPDYPRSTYILYGSLLLLISFHILILYFLR